MFKKIRILDCVIPLNLRPIASEVVYVASCLVNFQDVYVYDIEQEKKMLQCKHLTIFINPLFPNGSVLYLLKMSENLPGFQMAPERIKIEHWEVNGLTHVVLFY